MKPFTFILLCLISFTCAGTAEQEFPESYYSLLKQQGPIKIKTGFFLTDISEIDVEKETISFEGILTMKWKDSRLVFNPEKEHIHEKVYQGEYMLNEVFNGWWPSVILANESERFDISGSQIKVKPDGQITYIMEINANSKVSMSLKKLPFDSQNCSSVFEIMGFRKNEVMIEADPTTSGSRLKKSYSLEDWEIKGLDVNSVDSPIRFKSGDEEINSSFVVTIYIKRKFGFLFQIVIIPLIMLIVLSWSVFWMDRESVGDRMDLSFIGILSVVAYQIMVSENMPQISYFTLLSTFIYINYFILCGCILVNLLVSSLDKHDHSDIGNKLDRMSRWAFPLCYILLNAISACYFLL